MEGFDGLENTKLVFLVFLNFIKPNSIDLNTFWFIFFDVLLSES